MPSWLYVTICKLPICQLKMRWIFSRWVDLHYIPIVHVYTDCPESRVSQTVLLMSWTLTTFIFRDITGECLGDRSFVIEVCRTPVECVECVCPNFTEAATERQSAITYRSVSEPLWCVSMPWHVGVCRSHVTGLCQNAMTDLCVRAAGVCQNASGMCPSYCRMSKCHK